MKTMNALKCIVFLSCLASIVITKPLLSGNTEHLVLVTEGGLSTEWDNYELNTSEIQSHNYTTESTKTTQKIISSEDDTSTTHNSQQDTESITPEDVTDLSEDDAAITQHNQDVAESRTSEAVTVTAKDDAESTQYSEEVTKPVTESLEVNSGTTPYSQEVTKSITPEAPLANKSGTESSQSDIATTKSALAIKHNGSRGSLKPATDNNEVQGRNTEIDLCLDGNTCSIDKKDQPEIDSHEPQADAVIVIQNNPENDTQAEIECAPSHEIYVISSYSEVHEYEDYIAYDVYNSINVIVPPTCCTTKYQLSNIYVYTSDSLVFTYSFANCNSGQ